MATTTIDREALVLENKGLVYDAARRHARRWRRDFEDVVQDGMVGLVVAARKFDPDRGFQFSTIAVRWITQAIREGTQRDHLVGLPRPAWQLLMGWKSAWDGSPDRDDVLDSARRAAAYRAPGAGPGDATATAAEMVAARDGEDTGDRLDAREAVDRLPAAMRRVIVGRYFEGLRLDDLGVELGVTRQRVQQVEAAGLRRLRGLMGADGGGDCPATRAEAMAEARARARRSVDRLRGG